MNIYRAMEGTEAVSTLKERTGSSQYAITKFIEDKHKGHLPPNFKKLLLAQLKKLTAAGKLTKVKNSYKLPPANPPRPKVAAPPPPPVKPKPKPKAKAAAVAAPKPKAPVKPKAAKPKTTAKPRRPA